MPQNPEKYFYVNRVGLVRGSWALKKFLEDAERHHMEDQPAKLAALRLTEYYELIERLYANGQAPAPGAVISSNGHAPAIETTPATAAKNGSGRQRRVLQDDDDQQPGGTTPQPNQLDPEAALDESADYWGQL